MNDKMREEVLDSWNSWKYDIKDINRSEWTQRDESIMDAITKKGNNQILRKGNKKGVSVYNTTKEGKKAKKGLW